MATGNGSRIAPTFACTIQFEDYCRSRSELSCLLYPVQAANQRRGELNKTPITSVKPGDTVFINLRFFNWTWHDQLHLPNSDTTDYYVTTATYRSNLYTSSATKPFSFFFYYNYNVLVSSLVLLVVYRILYI